MRTQVSDYEKLSAKDTSNKKTVIQSIQRTLKNQLENKQLD